MAIKLHSGEVVVEIEKDYNGQREREWIFENYLKVNGVNEDCDCCVKSLKDKEGNYFSGLHISKILHPKNRRCVLIEKHK